MTPTNATVGDLLIGRQGAEGDLVFDKIEGWFTGAGVRGDFTTRPGVDGAFEVRTLRDARVVTISGWLYGSTRADTADLIKQVLAVGADKSPMNLTVVDPDFGTMAARVQLSAEPMVDWHTQQSARWQLTFTAPDPVLYGPERVHVLQFPTPVPGSGLQYSLTYPLDYGDAGAAVQSVFVPNPGTVPLFLRLRVEGYTVNPRVFTNHGSQLRFGLSVAEGSWLDVDTRERRVLANGVASRRYAVTYVHDWLAVPPGGATVSWDADVQDPGARLWIWAAEGAWI